MSVPVALQVLSSVRGGGAVHVRALAPGLIERGYAVEIAVPEDEEHSHAAMANAWQAGASGLPFAVLRGYAGTDLPEVNPNIRHITDPFTDERLAAVPAHRPDVGIIHAQRADRAGNVLIEGITRWPAPRPGRVGPATCRRTSGCARIDRDRCRRPPATVSMAWDLVRSS